MKQPRSVPGLFDVQWSLDFNYETVGQNQMYGDFNDWVDVMEV